MHPSARLDRLEEVLVLLTQQEVTFKKATVTVHVDAAKNNGKWLVEGMSVQPAGHNNPTH